MIDFKIKTEYAKALFQEISDLLEYEYKKQNKIKQGKKIKTDNIEYFLSHLAEAILASDFEKVNNIAAQEEHDK